LEIRGQAGQEGTGFSLIKARPLMTASMVTGKKAKIKKFALTHIVER
jgi:hypothetical protein